MAQSDIFKLSLGDVVIPTAEFIKSERIKTGLETTSLYKSSESTTTSTAPQRENWAWTGENGTIQGIHYFLTKETFSMANKIFRFGAFIKCVPFKLDLKNGGNLRVRPFEKKWQWALWHVVNWLIFAAVTFQYVSFAFLWQRADFGREMAFHILYLVYAAWIFVYFFPLYQNPTGCIVMLNHHDEIMRNSARLGLSRKHWASHPFVILSVYYLAWVFIIFNFVLIIFYLRNPERSQYVYSAIPSYWKKDGLDWTLYWICAVFEFSWMCCGSSLLCLFFCFWCADVYTFNGSLNELRMRTNVNENTIESYLFLQLFSISFNGFNGGFFTTGFCFLLVASPVLFIYLFLTTFDMLSIFVYLGFPAFAAIMMALIVLFLPQDSKVQIKSVDVLETFTHLPIGPRSRASNIIDLSHLTDTERRGYLRRRVKAFGHIRIQISFFGAFSLDTPAVMMDQIFNNVLLLLSL